MAIHILSYDLNKQKDYLALYQAIKSLGSWCHPVDSTFLVISSLSTAQVRDHVRAAMDGDDSLLVCTIPKGSGTAWSGMVPAAAEWLKANT